MSTSKRSIFLIVGPKGSGKTTLIGKLFGIKDLDFKEPAYYKDYFLDEKRIVREIAGKREVVNFLQIVAKLWNIEKMIIVGNASKPGEIPESFDMASFFTATSKCFALNKMDIGNENAREIARTVCEERGIPLFVVSCETGEGIEDLVSWISGRGISRKGFVEKTILPRKMVIPIPSGKIPLNINGSTPIEELRRRMPEPTLDDVERRILALIDGRKSISEISQLLKMSRFETAVKVRKLKDKGYIKELKIVVS